MPLFGKKKDQASSGKPAYPKATNPAQQGAYPAQTSAPQAGAAPPTYAPPPYTAAPQPQQRYQPAPQFVNPSYPGAPGYQQPYGQIPNANAYPGMPQFAPGTTVVGHGQFDAGARFGAGAGMNIPPPPPGCAPTAAQIAALHGGQVHMSQGKAGFFSTSSDGGMTTHFD